MNPQEHRALAIATAKHWLYWLHNKRALFLDTETTGLEDTAQAVEIAVVDREGLLQFHSLVKPTIPIPAAATQVHGIDEITIASAPGFGAIMPKLWNVLTKQPAVVIAYNAGFDSRILRQSARAVGIETDDWPPVMFNCAMTVFAQFNGEVGPFEGYRRKSLGAALRLCNLPLPNGLHRAAADADACRRVVEYMAMQEVE